jgi:hypothetical protein
VARRLPATSARQRPAAYPRPPPANGPPPPVNIPPCASGPRPYDRRPGQPFATAARAAGNSVPARDRMTARRASRRAAHRPPAVACAASNSVPARGPRRQQPAAAGCPRPRRSTASSRPSSAAARCRSRRPVEVVAGWALRFGDLGNTVDRN